MYTTRVVRQMQEFSELTQQYQNEEAACYIVAAEQKAFSTEAAAFSEELKQFHTTSRTSTKPF